MRVLAVLIIGYLGVEQTSPFGILYSVPANSTRHYFVRNVALATSFLRKTICPVIADEASFYSDDTNG